MVLERGGGEIHVYFRPRNANVTGFKSIRCERSDLIIPRSRHLLHYNSADRAPLCVHKAVQLSGNYYSDLPFQRCCCSVLRVVYCIVILFDENKLCVRVQTIFFFCMQINSFFFSILLNKFLNQYSIQIRFFHSCLFELRQIFLWQRKILRFDSSFSS